MLSGSICKVSKVKDFEVKDGLFQMLPQSVKEDMWNTLESEEEYDSKQNLRTHQKENRGVFGQWAFARQAFNERIVNGELEAVRRIKDVMEV